MNTTTAKSFIKGCDLANTVPLIQGVHGIGKSEIIRQYADENDMHCETLILSLMDTGDLCGLPRTAEHGGQLSTIWAAPVWFNRIIDAAWPAEFKVEDLDFKDQEFKEFVLKRIK